MTYKSMPQSGMLFVCLIFSKNRPSTMLNIKILQNQIVDLSSALKIVKVFHPVCVESAIQLITPGIVFPLYKPDFPQILTIWPPSDNVISLLFGYFHIASFHL